ncbi:pentatricopeptide repeat-containing protein At3g51320-like [Musa acuminata AAA Group]|uniref:pentatricopeptide repeat-containing protein At3g51320-like n=1 Tax=Musa acuminata AAA Group TaxID=214697 RepID=UPI0031D4FFB4
MGRQPLRAGGVLRFNPNLFSPPPPSSPPKRISLYHPSLRPLLSCRSLRGLLQAHAHFLVTGLLHDSFAASRLLKAAADSAAAPLSYTVLLFRSVPAPDAFCANVVLKALSLSLDPLLALPFFVANLRSGFAPNSFTFPVLFSACARASSLDTGETCHGQAVKRGVDAVLHVRNSLVHMYATCGLVGCARMLFDEMSHRDTVSWNSMIDGYVTSGELNSARELFDEMPGRNVVSWNVMIGGYVKERNPEMGLELFRLMDKKGLKGNDKTMVSVVTACGRLGKLNGGRSIHAYYTRNFVDDNVIFGTALVDMYSRCRRVDVARRVFEEMPKRNLVCWNAMIVGHCIHGDPLDGLALFDKMVGEGCDTHEETNDSFHLETTGISPDEVTFIGLLCACAREGLLTQGKKYFEQMTKLYNLKPTFAHYWCMANLYGGLGLVEEAEEVLRGMPEDEESLALGGLLGFCRFRGELELGESIAKRLVELEPSNGSRYSLLQNIYVAAGKWEDAHKVKEMMRNREIRSMPGHRLVDLNEIVHNFKIGDRSKPEIEKVYEMLDDVAARLRIRGATMDLTESVQQ